VTVDFTVAGQQMQGLNGGPEFRFNESVSFVIDCEDQAEEDRLWESLPGDGGDAHDGQNRGRRAGARRRRGLRAAWLHTS
jgi:predicted 3-demethylubiquinone-9 3-methyltransferase (glyoxalase superfamily)